MSVYIMNIFIKDNNKYLKKNIRICNETICYYIIMCHIFVININTLKTIINN